MTKRTNNDGITVVAHMWATTLLALPVEKRAAAVFDLKFAPGFYPFLRRAIKEKRGIR